jgi:LmbE family N-acetylglucosaminyl deacetylase
LRRRYAVSLLSALLRPVFRKERKVNWKRRLLGWAILAAFIVGSYYWQPLRYEVFPPVAPDLPRVTPAQIGLFEPGARVLIVAGHPDDSEFYLGGTLAQLNERGATVRLVCMTDGDKAYYPFGVPAGLTETRRAEQERAAEAWGGDAVFLGYKDGRLGVGDNEVEALVAQLTEFKPDIVFAADPKYRPRRAHRDHTNSGENALRAIVEWGEPCVVALYSTRAANCFVDISKTWDRKIELVAYHESQFGGGKMSFIADLLAGRALGYGEEAGVPLAEGLRIVDRRD